MPRQPANMSAADFCRSMGWAVGHLVMGDEGRGPETIRITAIGENSVLARSMRPSARESLWTFTCRDWEAAPDTVARNQREEQ